MKHEDPLSYQPGITPIDIGVLPKPEPSYQRRRIAPALTRTDITPNTYRGTPRVLTPSQVQEVYYELAQGDPERIELLKQVRIANTHLLHTYPEVGIYVDGRSITKHDVSPVGWWGDIITTGSWGFLLDHGKRITFISSQPSLFGRNEQDTVRGIRIPEEVPPFQFHPFSLPDQTSLLDFLYQQQTSNMVLLAPLNARLPLPFRLKKRDRRVDFTEETKRTIRLLEQGVYGKHNPDFSGIHMADWDQICHQLQAMQVMVDMVGIDTSSWTEFPKPYLNPPEAARILAQAYANTFSIEAVNALFHIGVATNFKPKEDKAYPKDKWKEVLTLIAQKKPNCVGSVIFFQPINPQQANETLEIAEHARQVLGNEKVVVLPIRRDWDLAALVAFMDVLAEKGGIFVGVDSAPAHIASARRLPLVQVGNRRFDPGFYIPEGAMAVLPAQGKKASNVRPEDVANTFIAVAESSRRN